MTSSVTASGVPARARGGMSIEELRSLPAAVSVATAARALGIGTDKAYALIKAERFPAKTIPVGETQKVATLSLWEALGVPS
ncbi:DNA-binding protein [Streptomyces chartreusis]|uniref:DNA-binding protein n=1 Tax=Streptomyces chartreusis TaxID=1969 RepID=UPI0038676BDA|nr:DNA-binding protein [Streptomyces chartreusis]